MQWFHTSPFRQVYTAKTKQQVHIVRRGSVSLVITTPGHTVSEQGWHMAEGIEQIPSTFTNRKSTSLVHTCIVNIRKHSYTHIQEICQNKVLCLLGLSTWTKQKSAASKPHSMCATSHINNKQQNLIMMGGVQPRKLLNTFVFDCLTQIVWRGGREEQPEAVTKHYLTQFIWRGEREEQPLSVAKPTYLCMESFTYLVTQIILFPQTMHTYIWQPHTRPCAMHPEGYKYCT